MVFSLFVYFALFVRGINYDAFLYITQIKPRSSLEHQEVGYQEEKQKKRLSLSQLTKVAAETAKKVSFPPTLLASLHTSDSCSVWHGIFPTDSDHLAFFPFVVKIRREVLNLT